jgi:hypothetical protein
VSSNCSGRTPATGIIKSIWPTNVGGINGDGDGDGDGGGSGVGVGASGVGVSEVDVSGVGVGVDVSVGVIRASCGCRGFSIVIESHTNPMIKIHTKQISTRKTAGRMPVT